MIDIYHSNGGKCRITNTNKICRYCAADQNDAIFIFTITILSVLILVICFFGRL